MNVKDKGNSSYKDLLLRNFICKVQFRLFVCFRSKIIGTFRNTEEFR
jgi:hypothetical protein